MSDTSIPTSGGNSLLLACKPVEFSTPEAIPASWSGTASPSACRHHGNAEHGPPATASGHHGSSIRDLVYCSEFITQWKELHLDVVLCPVLGPAFTTGYPGKLFTAISSTMLYNILNFPAGVVPVSTVTEADEEELELFQGC
ncbi:fatty-acid amide hydrolase 1-like isoform X1 [Corapipo altera]|uniref:fatty-acid amide hydrolase 1-like isoform X1 n=1 Tax=Corapipo altera TaxID=415028 RepID=UPI000FD62737|nr:fatty-acid amide hydrolase 1-like isoform X1 [Corapipo altera]